MKRLHRPNLYGWSVFNPDRDIDFHAVLWVRADGNIAFSVDQLFWLVAVPNLVGAAALGIPTAFVDRAGRSLPPAVRPTLAAPSLDPFSTFLSS